MPIKLRFPLEGEPPPSPYQHATGLRALLLRWLEGEDPELSSMIHDSNQPKPYTVSPLWSETAPGRHYFEVSVLSDWIAEPLVAGMSRSGEWIRLGMQRYRILPPKPVSSATWAELLEGGLPKELTFRLLSPTAHHLSGSFRKSVVLPTPELYFGSWYGRWNLCCEEKLEERVLQVVEERVGVSSCKGETKMVRMDPGRVFVGFEGVVRFSILKAETLAQEERRALGALARFAGFCQTGVDTMRGMG